MLAARFWIPVFGIKLLGAGQHLLLWLGIINTMVGCSAQRLEMLAICAVM